METRKKKSFKRLFAFLMAFVMVASLAMTAVFAAEPTFKDVPADHDFYTEIEDLYEKEVISGYGGSREGFFGPDDKLTRAQAAKMVARAAGYTVSKGFKTSFTDVDEDVDMYEYIWALEEAEIVKGYKDTTEFKPREEIERGHVAKMVAKAFGIADGSKDVKFSDLPADEEVAEAIMALATNDIVKGYGTSGEFRPTLPVTRGQFAKMVSRAMNLELEIVEAEAVTPTIVELTLNKKLAKLARTDVVITNVKTSDRQYVKGVELDDEVVEVELFDALQTKNTYKAKIAKSEKEFDYVLGVKRIVVAPTPQIVPAGEATAIEYEIFDEYGLDVTGITDVAYESNVALDLADKITLAKGKQAFVYVVAVDDQGKELARSGRILVKAEERKNAKLIAYTLGSDNFGEADFKAKAFKPVFSLRKTVDADHRDYLSAYVEDQFGKKTVIRSTFESLNKEVALVDLSTGLVTPLKVGSFAVRITSGAINELVMLEVEADAKIAGLELEKATLELSDKILAGEDVEVTLVDQYDKVYKINGEVTSKTLSGEGIVTVEAKKFLIDGVTAFTVKPVEGKEGIAIIEFTYKESDLISHTAKLTVTVSKAGDLDDYIVEGFKEKLDLNTANVDKLPKKMDLKVFGVDNKGVKVEEIASTGYTVALTGKDKDGKAIAAAEIGTFVDYATGTITAKKVGTFTVEISVGTWKVFNGQFEVIDTTVDPVTPDPKLEQVKDKIELPLGATKNDLLAALGTVFYVDGVAKVYADADFITENSAVMTEAGVAQKVGKAILTFSKLKYGSDEILVPNLRVEVTVSLKISKIQKPVWTADTLNKTEMNDFMAALWAKDSVLSYADGTLTVDIAKITADHLLFIKTNYDPIGASVPVALDIYGVPTGLSKMTDWDNAYLDWIGLDVTKNGTVDRVVSDVDGLAYQVTYIGGVN